MGLIDKIKQIEPDKKKRPLAHTAYDAFFTFLATPNTVTKSGVHLRDCLLYTSPSPRDRQKSRMPSSA